MHNVSASQALSHLLPRRSLGFAAFGLLALAAPAAQAQFHLQTLLYDPPGADNGKEAVVIAGPPSTFLTGWWLLAIEGDGNQTGIVDMALPLTGWSTGSNGLLLIRDADQVLLPGPAPETNVVIFDFTPDIENGSNTFVLGFGQPPAVGTNLDLDNDGVLDVPLGVFLVADAVAILAPTGVNQGYADDLGFPEAQFGPFQGPLPAQHMPMALKRLADPEGAPFAWGGGVLTGPQAAGPWAFSHGNDRVFGFPEAGFASMDLDLGHPSPRVSLAGDRALLRPGEDTVQVLRLAAGASHAGKPYLILGTTSGLAQDLFLGSFVFPVQPDVYTYVLLGMQPQNLPKGFLGVLNGYGRAQAEFRLPNSMPAGLQATVHHVGLVLDPVTAEFALVTNAAKVEVWP